MPDGKFSKADQVAGLRIRRATVRAELADAQKAPTIKKLRGAMAKAAAKKPRRRR